MIFTSQKCFLGGKMRYSLRSSTTIATLLAESVWIHIVFLYVLSKELVYIEASIDLILHKTLVNSHASWNSWWNMAVVCFLPGKLVISSTLVSLKTKCMLIFCSPSIPTLSVRSYPHMVFHTTATWMTLNSPSPFLPQPLMFPLRSQHV